MGLVLKAVNDFTAELCLVTTLVMGLVLKAVGGRGTH